MLNLHKFDNFHLHWNVWIKYLNNYLFDYYFRMIAVDDRLNKEIDHLIEKNIRLLLTLLFYLEDKIYLDEKKKKKRSYHSIAFQMSSIAFRRARENVNERDKKKHS